MNFNIISVIIISGKAYVLLVFYIFYLFLLGYLWMHSETTKM